jgi:coenzyme F420-reducing hydrogenase delta subunit
MVIPVPCSSSIKPSWVLHALEQGFDGVFIAADGTDCAYVTDCGDRTAQVIEQAQGLLREHGYDTKRLKMAGVCSVCAESFVAHMEKFHKLLSDLPSS